MEDDETVHEIFKQDPVELMGFIDCFVKIVLENGEVITGTVYTIDPVSQRFLDLKEISGRTYVKLWFLSPAGNFTRKTAIKLNAYKDSVILFTKEKSGELTMKIVLKLSIKSMDKVSDIPEDQKIITSLMFQSEKMCPPSYTKQQVKSWLEKNMIPVIENDDKLIVDSLEIHPPYGVENCYCSNSIVLSRIQNLLKQMPAGT